MSIIGVDTGGTFTDFVGRVDGAWCRLKLPSTPDEPARAVIAGVARLLSECRDADPDEPGGESAPASPRLVHGSTVATNALLERTGARCALVTNRGFEDLIEIGRQDRPLLYALENRRPEPLVARDDRVGIAGRIAPDGTIEEPLSDAELDRLAARLAGIESVIVCLLHGYARPDQERRVAEALRRAGCALTLAAELVPEFREYERLSTAVVNGYVLPLMAGYLGALGERLGRDAVTVMGSGGGWLSIDRAAAEPVRTVLSGPAGGVLGARAVAAAAGADRIVTLDMGGTSADVALCPGEPLRTRALRVADQPLAIDVLDVHTIGSGGGSIAWVDPAGALRVGPRSAGARPGPACYGFGGESATVTDANVVLGRLPTDAFELDGRPLDGGAALRALERLAAALGVDAVAAAQAVVDAVDAAMEAALRLVSVERGYDPAEFTLVAFGGAAGLHAASLAERVGVAGILLPPDPGILSAYGMVVAPARKDASRSVLWSEGGDVDARIDAVLRELEAETRSALVRDGLPEDAIAARRWVDARYLGQSHELRVAADGWSARFHAAHEAAFGYRRAENPVQAVTLRVEALAHDPDHAGARLDAPDLAAGTAARRASGAPGAAESGAQGAGSPAAAERTVPVRWRGTEVGARALDRSALDPGSSIDGPAILTEYTSTTWVPPGWRALVLPTLAIDLRARSDANSTPARG